MSLEQSDAHVEYMHDTRRDVQSSVVAANGLLLCFLRQKNPVR